MAQDNNQFQPQYNNTQNNNIPNNISPVINNGYTPYQNNLTNNQNIGQNIGQNMNQNFDEPLTQVNPNNQNNLQSNIQDFSPNQNFDTGIGTTTYSSVNYPSINPNSFNPDTNPNFIPSGNSNANPNIDYTQDLEQNLYTNSQPQFETQYDSQYNEKELEEKPVDNKKKYIIYSLIGLSVLILVAGISFFVWSKTQTPAIDPFSGTTSIQPADQSGTATSSASNSNTQTNTPSLTKPSAIEAIRTGTGTTPASKSLLYPATSTLPTDWLIKNFDKKNLAEDGTCKVFSVCGEKSDPDNDKLTNVDEYRYGTNPNKTDTDGDGVSDGDELYVYFSNPRADDTDGDTYKDGSELVNCYDTNIANQSFSKARLNEISSNLSKPWNSKGLSEITITTLKKAGATADDLEKGYLSKCGTPTSKTSSIESVSSIPVNSSSKIAVPIAQTTPTDTTEIATSPATTESSDLATTPTLETTVLMTEEPATNS